MSFFQNTSRSVTHTKRTRSDIYKRIYAAVIIGSSILMAVILDLVMPFNVTREALIMDKICEMSYEKAVEIGLDMSREKADLDKLLESVLKVNMDEMLFKDSVSQTEIRALDEIFDATLTRLFENVTAIGFDIKIDDVSTEKNCTDIKRAIRNKVREDVNMNISTKKYDSINVTQLVLDSVYKKASGIIADKVWKNARITVSKDISVAQVFGAINDNVKKFYEKIHDMNITAPVIIALIAAVIGQIAAVVISIIGTQKSKVCIYIMMVGYALGLVYYIFFPLAGMNFTNLSTSFPTIFSTITIPGEVSKYLLLDMLLKIISLIALYKFKRVKYDTYDTE